MPTSAETPGSWAVDTSVAVAALDSTHAAHADCLAAVRDHRPALAGHAAFETFSVLTRMPGAAGVDAPTAAEIMDRVFPETVWLSPSDAARLRQRLATAGLIGGAVYDALVGEAARTNDGTLLTRDRRALATYDLLGVRYHLLEG